MFEPVIMVMGIFNYNTFLQDEIIKYCQDNINYSPLID